MLVFTVLASQWMMSDLNKIWCTHRTESPLSESEEVLIGAGCAGKCNKPERKVAIAHPIFMTF